MDKRTPLEKLNPYQTDIRVFWQSIRRPTVVPVPDIVVIERKQRQARITDFFKKTAASEGFGQ
ncbi:hypothetical protein AAVH_21745 [Aphelenchoides avenae]|nr:hypothetical protein AAVH_21745 [Aphelenchus avenae]